MTIDSRFQVQWAFGTKEFPLGGLSSHHWEEIKPQWCQVHGTKIKEIKAPGEECGEVDGFFTRIPEFPVSVVTADCVPILLFHQEGRAVAALHAGWRGTYSKIIESFFQSLPNDLNSPENWRAVLGPSIRTCCYEVSLELIEQFRIQFPELAPAVLEPKPRHLDLIAVNSEQLNRLKVPIHLVHPDCTFCKKTEKGFQYHSYRRGDRNSRQYSWIQIRSRN